MPYLPLPELQKRAPATAEGSKLMTNRLPIIGVIVAVILFLIYSSVFVVNEREQAIVLRFGEIVDVKTEPGIYFKAPFAFFEADNVQIIEDRCCASTSTTSASRFRAASSTRSTPSSPTASPIRARFRAAVSGSVELAEAAAAHPSRRRAAPRLRPARLRGRALGGARRR